MRIKEITVGLSGVIPVASYQNLKPSYSMTIELGDADNVDMISAHARMKLRQMFESEENRAKSDLIEKEYSNIRFYEKNGMKYPSVTSITGFDVDWSITEDELMQYGCRGTIIHKLIEIYLTTGKWVEPADVPELKNDLAVVLGGSKKLSIEDCSYKTAVESLSKDLKVLEIEKTVYNDVNMYAGRLDLIAEYKGIKSILDFKTGSTTDMRQLSAYSACLDGVKQMVIVPVGMTDNKSGFKKPIVSTAFESEFKGFLKQRSKFHKRFGI